MLKTQIIYASVPNHYSYYESIIYTLKFSKEEVIIYGRSDMNNKKNVVPGGFYSMIFFALFSVKSSCNVYVEEYSSLIKLLSLSFISRIFKRKLTFSLAIHNVNTWLLLSYNSPKREILRFFIKKFILKSAKDLIVISEQVRVYAQEIVNNTKPLKTVPFRAVLGLEISNSRFSKIFCIPGNVEEHRRDYQTVFSAFCSAMQVDKEIKLVLLGKYDPASVSPEFKKTIDSMLENFSGRFVVFYEHVEDEVFMKYIHDASYLICNLVRYFKSPCGAVEIYGISKETGIRVLADCFDKRCLLPEYIQAGEKHDNYEKYHDTKDLIQKILAVEK